MDEQVANGHTSEMLEEMIKATHHLDDILQRLCDANISSNEQTNGLDNASETSEEGDVQFTDCSENFNSDDIPVTSTSYFESIRKAFHGAGGKTLKIANSTESTKSLFESLVGDLLIRFATCTRETSFVFNSQPLTIRGDDVETSSPLESNLSFSEFVSRLKQQIITCDHIVPTERANEASQLAFLLLEMQQRRLLGAISNHFPYQRDSVYWVQSYRVCEVVVQETEQNHQWGLQIKLNVTSHLQARVDEKFTQGNDNEISVESDPQLSSCTHCQVFLPKTCYLGTFSRNAAFQTSIAVELELYDPKAGDSRSNESKKHRDCENRMKCSKAADDNALSPMEMPEMIEVSMWGSLHENPILNNPSINPPVSKSRFFQRVDFKSPFPRNRIVQAACGRFHTLFLNDTGLLFAYGHTVDGALGLGNNSVDFVAQPTLVDFFLKNLIIIQSVSCGGDQLAGAHSAAVSQKGELYTWGVGITLGNGTLRSASTPQKINLPSVERRADPADVAKPVTMAASVSCGSGFCVALTRDGYAFSWGKWSNGRLGLGRIPVIARTSRRHGGGAIRKQFQSFQLTPKLIKNVHSAQGDSKTLIQPLFSRIACGDGHCIGLTRSGALVTWGRGNSGQQGRGLVCDALTPTLVLGDRSQMRWRDVAAGENWSMALSINGQIWSWGACGGAVLGRGLYGSQKNALLVEKILQRQQGLLSKSRQSALASSSCPRFPQLGWMTPQMIPCFTSSDCCICRISAGGQHAAAISSTGDLYMWGENYLDNTDVTGLVLSSIPTLVNSGQQVREEEMNIENVMDIGTHSVEDVVCGGHQTIVLTSNSFLARSLTKLYRHILALEKHFDHTRITGVDLILIVSGQRLLAHKVLLAQRSPVLRKLILDEEQQYGSQRTASDGDDIMELLLPTLRVDVARPLLEYIYTDDFKIEASKKSYYLLHDVLRASKLYKLPSLALLCRQRILSTSPSSLSGTSVSSPGVSNEGNLSDTNSEEDGETTDQYGNTEVTRTLNDDMKFALSDPILADTILIAEERSILVHRYMLIARSEYFRAVLEFRRSTAQKVQIMHAEKKMAVVHVEDSYASIVRVLRFIYFDQVTLPKLKQKDADAVSISLKIHDECDSEADVNDQLLEDLVAADKYGLERMKRLCEHAIRVNSKNCLEVLAVAELVHAAHLKQVAMRFVQNNLADFILRQDEFQRFRKDFPQLLEELYATLRDASRDEFLLQKWHADVVKILAAQREEKEVQCVKASDTVKIPWLSLCLAIAFGTSYLSVMHAQEYEYSSVPATNLVAIVTLVGAIVMGYI
ncbi:E3 ubiquitin protein ligase [Plasmopara halstedii]|uniref:E3 ubiquitin protein ligase n=1 Tax=Plasmopara halstedii TaxID=4781 RepID=A0A0P1AT24_PLAHL|nr:E3 ubiquitin protein ligase [Plasmopara halstedii]CEG45165.1 E3 ubiquitin protein ligase [Plasmopara halstedii]|eukprot:XP_024581534.1 E3 ubiquitin protein ligase [Plasmopara halstedii]